MKFKAIIIGGFLACSPHIVLACGEPTEQWRYKNSHVVFEGNASCDRDAKTCAILVSKVIKNKKNFDIKGRSIKVDFQNHQPYSVLDDGEVVALCGLPIFKPDQMQFRARFYANVDPETSKLVVQLHRNIKLKPSPQESE